ncbi:MAG TPA: hypothetical protein VFI17_07355 [Solirubrobacterales bacterium]|nr:hypothetical protein [Solirubrobacterales bacterium]
MEFHLQVARSGSSLGDPPRHWGWQCRWYAFDDLRRDGRLRRSQRQDIEDAIEKSAAYLGTLTDWVLWTREKLGAADAEWFQGLAAPFDLHHWDEETVVGLLDGGSEMLRQTWFGELVLTDVSMVSLRQEALAPVRQRYRDALHVRTPSELGLRWSLPDRDVLVELKSCEEATLRAREAIARSWRGDGMSRNAEKLYGQLRAALHASARQLREVHDALANGDIPDAETVASVDPGLETRAFEMVIQELELDARSSLLSTFTSGMELLPRARDLLDRLARGLATPLLAVVGGAGAGKTHLAAHLSGPDDRPRGLLLLGRQFGGEIGDDQLASVAGIPGVSRDQLLEALEARGARTGCRVPLLIDGLNESDDPRKWQDALARLGVRLGSLRHVIGIVTVRPRYVEFALPDDLPRIDLPGFVGVVDEAIERYFRYYRIKADPRDLHWWPPSHPLLLSIFCRTVNPDRSQEIIAAQLPDSLTKVFEAYLTDVYRRIAGVMEIDADTISSAVSEFAHRLFAKSLRGLPRPETDLALGDDLRARWTDSLRFQLESEELLVRDMVDGVDHVLWSYDLLAGYVIAKSIVERTSDWGVLRSPGFLIELEQHPLFEDIVVGLSGLLSQRGVDLTHIVAGRELLHRAAILALPRLPASEVEPASIRAIKKVFAQAPEDTLDALFPTAFTEGHVLNATVLDHLLRHLAPWERDLSWTEWVRERGDTIRAQVGRFATEAEAGEEVGEAALVWLGWLLTTTDWHLHNDIIHALYRIGRVTPERLFERTQDMLDVSDPLVAEGLMAASYGVAMAVQDPDSGSKRAVIRFASHLRRRLFDDGPPLPTTNWFLREYAYRTLQLAAWISGGEFEAPTNPEQPPMRRADGAVARLKRDSPDWHAVDGAFVRRLTERMLAMLPTSGGARAGVEDLDPILEEVRARIAEFGWTETRFRDLDAEILAGSPLLDTGGVGTYGAKYGLLAFHEAMGRMSDQAGFRFGPEDGWRLRMPIDPSFPAPAVQMRLPLPEWADWPGPDAEWLSNAECQLPAGLLRAALSPEVIPFVAVDGFLQQRLRHGGRGIEYTIKGVIALEGWSTVESHLSRNGLDFSRLPSKPPDHQHFAGEVPWSPTFDAHATAADGTVIRTTLRLEEGLEPGPEVEPLAVPNGWDRNRLPLNARSTGSAPGKSFAWFASMRSLPDRPEWVDAQGRLAARLVSPVAGEWSGHLLYVRQDLVENYCREHGGEWGWIAAGERQLDSRTVSKELARARERGEHRFNHTVSLSQLLGERTTP